MFYVRKYYTIIGRDRAKYPIIGRDRADQLFADAEGRGK